MKITYDPAKNARNIDERGLSFDRAADFDFETALMVQDDRKDYGELRIRALGMLDRRVHQLTFVETESGIRVISFRRANKRETRKWHAVKK